MADHEQIMADWGAAVTAKSARGWSERPGLR